MQIRQKYLNASLCKFVVNSLQRSETFDVSRVFLPRTIAELSTLKQVRFFWPTLYMACRKPLPELIDDMVISQPWNHSKYREVCSYIQKTRADNKTPVNVCIKYHVKTATKLTLEKQAELSEYVFRNTDRTRRDVKAYTGSTSKSASTEQNKSAVTDHAIFLNHVIYWDRAKVIDR